MIATIELPSNAGVRLAGRGNTNRVVGETNSTKLIPYQLSDSYSSIINQKLIYNINQLSVIMSSVKNNQVELRITYPIDVNSEVVNKVIKALETINFVVEGIQHTGMSICEPNKEVSYVIFKVSNN